MSNVHNISDLDISDGSSLGSTDSSNTEITNNNDQNHDDWPKNFSAVRCEQFNGADPGPTTVLPGDANKLDFFQLMFNAALFEEIASKTNRYAEDKIRQKPDPKWRGVTAEEIKAYIGVKIITGIVSVPNTLYFTKDTLFHSTGISDKFSRDRLDNIEQYFHVCDNSGNPSRGADGHDKLSHVRSIITHVKANSMSQYNTHPETTN